MSNPKLDPMLPAGTLDGQVAIITGGGTGIGKCIAEFFVALGAKVVLASRRQEVLDAAKHDIEAKGGEALAIATDVRDYDAVASMVAQTIDEWGRVDILINNAAGNFFAPVANMSVNAWNAVVGIVLHGSFHCMRAVAPHMLKQKYGRIVSILATYAWTGGPGTAHSASAKAGVLTLTQSCAIEWAGFGVRVNAIAPGPVETDGAGSRLWPNDAVRTRIEKGVPIKRFGHSEEIANAACYLVSPYADFINGECLVVDAGAWLNRGMLNAGG